MADVSADTQASASRSSYIGRFKILRKHGTSPWADVYTVRDDAFSGRLNLYAEWLSHDPSFRANFERMASVMVSLEHSSLGRSYEFGIFHGRLYTVEEQFEEPSVRAIGRILDARAPITALLVKRVIVDLCDALQTLHTLKYPDGDPIDLIYRDPFPGHMFFDPTGHIRLRAPGPWSSIWLNLTRFGIRDRQTEFYRAPEDRMAGLLNVTSDLYALTQSALIMYLPAQPHAAETRVQKHLTRSLKQLTASHPDIGAVLAKAIRPDPRDRYQSAQEMIDAMPPLSENEREETTHEIRQFLQETREEHLESLETSVQNIHRAQFGDNAKPAPDNERTLLHRRPPTINLPPARRTQPAPNRPSHRKHSDTPDDTLAFDAPPPTAHAQNRDISARPTVAKIPPNPDSED